MRHKLTVLTVSIAAVLATKTVGLTGVAAADGTYHVQGTGGLGVRVHTQPNRAAPVVEVLPEGSSINIICQTYGDAVTDPANGVTSAIWDRVGNNRVSLYISDLYASTPSIGQPSPGLPLCGGPGGGTGGGVGGVPNGVM